MTNNQMYTASAVIGTALTCLLLYVGWDSDGFWLRQFTLFMAGYVARTVIRIIGLIEE